MKARALASRSGSTCIQRPRTRTSRCPAAASSSTSSSVSPSSPTSSSHRTSTRPCCPIPLTLAVAPGWPGVLARSRAPSRACGRPHQPGSSTPKPLASSSGAVSDRKSCAPPVSSSSSAGRARAQRRREAGEQPDRPPELAEQRLLRGRPRAGRGRRRRARPRSASTTRLGSTLACSPSTSRQRCSSSSSSGSSRRKQARTAAPPPACACQRSRSRARAATSRSVAVNVRAVPLNASVQVRVRVRGDGPRRRRTAASTSASVGPAISAAVVASARSHWASAPVSTGSHSARPLPSATRTAGSTRPRAGEVVGEGGQRASRRASAAYAQPSGGSSRSSSRARCRRRGRGGHAPAPWVSRSPRPAAAPGSAGGRVPRCQREHDRAGPGAVDVEQLGQQVRLDRVRVVLDRGRPARSPRRLGGLVGVLGPEHQPVVRPAAVQDDHDRAPPPPAPSLPRSRHRSRSLLAASSTSSCSHTTTGSHPAAAGWTSVSASRRCTDSS